MRDRSGISFPIGLVASGARRLIIIELAANLREDLDTGRTRPIVRRSEVEL
jgi:hypothetical protein